MQRWCLQVSIASSVSFLVPSEMDKKCSHAKGNISLFSNSRVQVGLWDGSFEYGTAEWAKGPIDVSYANNIYAYRVQHTDHSKMAIT